MNNIILDPDVETLVRRLDSSSAQNLLTSLATELFRLAKAHAALNARVTAMESFQTTIDRILVAEDEAESIVFPSNVLVEAADSLQNTTGLFPLEHDERGRAFRWTGPNANFSFQLFFDRRAVKNFNLQFKEHVTRLTPEWMRCFIDGDEVPVHLIRLADGYQLRGEIPSRPYQGGSLLVFICPTAVPSDEHKAGSDSRPLGITFQSLIIEPLPTKNKPAPNITGSINDAQVEKGGTVKSVLDVAPPNIDAALEAPAEFVATLP